MTKPQSKDPETKRGDDVARCRWCRRILPPTARTGRPRQFCRQACRQWDWVARQRARELALSDDELIVARSELDALRDDLFVLAHAVADVRRDLAAPGNRTQRELDEALMWLLDAAAPLCDRDIARPTPQRP